MTETNFNSIMVYLQEMQAKNDQNYNKMYQLTSQLETKIYQRMDQLEGRINQRMDQLEGRINQRMDQLSLQINHVEARLNLRIDTKLAQLEEWHQKRTKLQMTQFEERLDLGMNQLFDRKINEFKRRLEINRAHHN